MQSIKKENLKDIKLKNAKYCHIFKDRIEIFFEKSDKQGIKTMWQEICPNPIKFYIHSGKNSNSTNFMIDDYLIGFLKDIIKVEYYPENYKEVKKEIGLNIEGIYIHTKKGIIPIQHIGKYKSHIYFLNRESEENIFSY